MTSQWWPAGPGAADAVRWCRHETRRWRPRGGRGGGTARLRGRVAPMTRVVLSIGSNLGDRLARLQSVPARLGSPVQAVSPVYETAAWGGVEQGPFLNAVLIADDPTLDG